MKKIILVFILILSVGISQAQDCGCNYNALAVKYAPRLWLHSDEPSEVSSADWYLDYAGMRHKDRTQVAAPGSLGGTSDISGITHNGEVSGNIRSNFALEIPANQGSLVKDGDVSKAKVYVNIGKRQINDIEYSEDVYIQYWFFYPNQGPKVARIPTSPVSGFNFYIGEHEGDWENVTVRLNGTCGDIKKVYFSAHGGEGRWHDISDISTDGHHPIVYSALNTHANYPTQGTQRRDFVRLDNYIAKVFAILWEILTFGQVQSALNTAMNEKTNQGTKFDSWNHVQIINNFCDSDPAITPKWLDYGGRWGKYVRSGTSRIPSDGPHGPQIGSTWTDFNDNIAFYTGLNATGRLVTNVSDAMSTGSRHVKNLGDDFGINNDVIRSLRIFTARAGTKIKIYDDITSGPNGDDIGSTASDYITITILRNIDWSQGMLIPKLEYPGTMSTPFYKIVRHGNTGLHGKVSFIEVFPGDGYNPATVNTGPGVICASTTTRVAVHDLPPCEGSPSVSWNVTPTNFLVSNSGTGTVANLQPVNNTVRGFVTIHFNYNGSCKSAVYSQQIWVGRPADAQASDLMGPTNIIPGQYSYQMSMPAGTQAFKWYLPSNWSAIGGTTSSLLRANVGSVNRTQRVRIVSKPTNACDVTGNGVVGGSLDITVSSDGSGFCPNPPCAIVDQPIAFPNPAGDRLTIVPERIRQNNELDHTVYDSDAPNHGNALSDANTDNSTYHVTLIDSGQKVVYNGFSKSGNDLVVNTAALPNGMYFLILKGEGKVVRRHIVVQH